MYCQRRWGLIEINGDWQENVPVVKSELMHERVHNKEHEFSTKDKKVMSSVPVYNDELDIYGVLDCLEFEKNDAGTYIPSLNGKYTVKIVEYKPTKPKNEPFLETDAIQTFAQKLCVDSIFGCDSSSYIYYADIRKRIKIPFESCFEKYHKMIMQYLAEMRGYRARHEIPKVKKNQKCNGCSFADICMPKCGKSNVKSQILSLLEEV